MKKGAESWLTLAEVIHRSNFNDIEARRRNLKEENRKYRAGAEDRKPEDMN